MRNCGRGRAGGAEIRLGRWKKRGFLVFVEIKGVFEDFLTQIYYFLPKKRQFLPKTRFFFPKKHRFPGKKCCSLPKNQRVWGKTWRGFPGTRRFFPKDGCGFPKRLPGFRKIDRL